MSDVIERTELLVPGPAEALGALLGIAGPNLEQGARLPLLWHWVYLLERPAQADLGPDGHPAHGTLPVPPGPGRRRMWAGGQVRTSGPLRCGEPATRRSRILSVQDKQGRSGPLTFLAMQHQILQRGKVVIDERQDLVYRGAPSDPPARYEADRTSSLVVPLGDDEWQVDVSPVLLFRFSALTYNAHRIHYDRDYARDAEGYPGLLTHGPLQALVMAEAARAAQDSVEEVRDQDFAYRLESPLFDHQGMIVRAAGDETASMMSVRDIYGRRTASGTLRYSGQ